MNTYTFAWDVSQLGVASPMHGEATVLSLLRSRLFNLRRTNIQVEDTAHATMGFADFSGMWFIQQLGVQETQLLAEPDASWWVRPSAAATCDTLLRSDEVDESRLCAVVARLLDVAPSAARPHVRKQLRAMLLTPGHNKARPASAFICGGSFALRESQPWTAAILLALQLLGLTPEALAWGGGDPPATMWVGGQPVQGRVVSETADGIVFVGEHASPVHIPRAELLHAAEFAWGHSEPVPFRTAAAVGSGGRYGSQLAALQPHALAECAAGAIEGGAIVVNGNTAKNGNTTQPSLLADDEQPIIKHALVADHALSRFSAAALQGLLLQGAWAAPANLPACRLPPATPCDVCCPHAQCPLPRSTSAATTTTRRYTTTTTCRRAR